MSEERDERLQNELSLLEAMYPEQIAYNSKSRELKYSLTNGSFTLRLPASYLTASPPEVVSASIGKSDEREHLREQVKVLSTGEEVLDSIIAAFTELSQSAAAESRDISSVETQAIGTAAKKATVIVWLHHLLNTNKRKQALSPPSPEVSGLTKPGYPGVLIYSGSGKAVHEHVNELKGLNWQAFQVRLEEEEEWSFAHGSGVKEVESMKEIVAEIGEAKKQLFMEAMRMK